MDYIRIRTEKEAITRNNVEFEVPTGNIYKSICILSKRANQVAVEMKQAIDEKLNALATTTDNLEEIHENREQIEAAQHYERLPKPTLISIHEFKHEEIYWRDPEAEAKEAKEAEAEAKDEVKEK